MNNAATSSDRTQRLRLAASLSSVISAFVASVCCIGPLVLALLGIGGAGLLLKFEPYRPFFITATVCLLATGFYLTYRKPVAVPEAACACEVPGAGRTSKLMLWLATVLVLAFLAFPYLAPVLFG